MADGSPGRGNPRGPQAQTPSARKQRETEDDHRDLTARACVRDAGARAPPVGRARPRSLRWRRAGPPATPARYPERLHRSRQIRPGHRRRERCSWRSCVRSLQAPQEIPLEDCHGGSYWSTGESAPRVRWGARPLPGRGVWTGSPPPLAVFRVHTLRPIPVPPSGSLRFRKLLEQVHRRDAKRLGERFERIERGRPSGRARAWRCRRSRPPLFVPRRLRRLLNRFLGYYNEDRTHLGVGKDSPHGRPVEFRPSPSATVASLPRVGGLHRRYAWRHAAWAVSPQVAHRDLAAKPPSPITDRESCVLGPVAACFPPKARCHMPHRTPPFPRTVNWRGTGGHSGRGHR